jgi:hypothetical protein
VKGKYKQVWFDMADTGETGGGSGLGSWFLGILVMTVMGGSC